MSSYDAVWYYRDCSGSTELRYSMRTASANLNLRRIVLLCTREDLPAWFVPSSRAVHIESPTVKYQRGVSIDPSWGHMSHWLASGLAGEEFLLFNDDFYILQPIAEWTDYYRDPADYNAKARRNRYYARRTEASWHYYSGPAYNLHMPMRLVTSQLRKMLEWWEQCPTPNLDFRTLYGCMFPTGAVPHCDVKNDISSGDFYSSSNDFERTPIGQRIMQEYTAPSIAEG